MMMIMYEVSLIPLQDMRDFRGKGSSMVERGVYSTILFFGKIELRTFLKDEKMGTRHKWKATGRFNVVRKREG